MIKKKTRCAKNRIKSLLFDQIFQKLKKAPKFKFLEKTLLGRIAFNILARGLGRLAIWTLVRNF